MKPVLPHDDDPLSGAFTPAETSALHDALRAPAPARSPLDALRRAAAEEGARRPAARRHALFRALGAAAALIAIVFLAGLFFSAQENGIRDSESPSSVLSEGAVALLLEPDDPAALVSMLSGSAAVLRLQEIGCGLDENDLLDAAYPAP